MNYWDFNSVFSKEGIATNVQTDIRAFRTENKQFILTTLVE